MIIHADMDAFFASVEIRDQPELKDKPVVVAGQPGQRGVVAAANYIARQFGVHSAMPTVTALKRCPELIILPGRMALYSKVSSQIHAIFSRYTPLIEPLSLDEAFLDVRASEALFGKTVDIARRIKREIQEELDLVVSVGVAPNKFLAKIASDLEKPDGFVVVDASNVQAFLDPLPVSRLWGVGKVTEQQLHDLNIHTIAELRRLPADKLTRRFGQLGEHLWQLAHGQDDRTVSAEREAKSLSHETTFAQDISDPDVLRSVLFNLTEQVACRMQSQALRGCRVHLKLRFADFRTITRVHSLQSHTDATAELWSTVSQLFNKVFPDKPPAIRLIGMGVSGFNADLAPAQLTMFDQPMAEANKVDKLADDINNRFGNTLLSRARGLRRPR